MFMILVNKMQKLLVVAVLLVFSTVTFSSCYVFRAYKNRKFELKSLDRLESVTLPASSQPFSFAYNFNKHQTLNNFLDTALENTFTYSYLVIQNDSIVYEKYFNPVNEKTKQPSFSVAKSFISTLVQIAVQEGYIKSLNEPITNYLPYLAERNKAFNNITIQHVMNMASGIKSSENYSNPFSDVLHMGFTKNLNNRLKKLKIEKAPGSFDYKSVNTQLLAAIIEKATNQKLQAYFIQKLWNPLGMEYEANWNIDSKKNTTPRAFCCINATTKDFAKLGKLYLNNGKYNGKQIVDSVYIVQTTLADSMAVHGGYKNQWWAAPPQTYFLDSLEADAYHKKTPQTKTFVTTYKDKKYFGVYHQKAAYYAEGILEQFIYINPRTNVIIVRLGHYWNHKKYNALNFIGVTNSLLSQ